MNFPRSASIAAALALAAAVALPIAARAADVSYTSQRAGIIKGKTKLAIGAFRVVFVTSDSIGATSTNNAAGTFVKADVNADANLIGLEKPVMQKIADGIYADFLSKASAAGYTVLDSKQLASLSTDYKDLATTENFESGRWGTYVIPTGQMSVALAADDSDAVGRGSKGGIFSGFKQVSQRNKKSDVDKVMPAISKAANAPIAGVTVVVSFAKFKGSGYSHWGQSAKTKIEFGATINGATTKQDAMVSGVQLWESDMYHNCSVACPVSMVMQVGDVHDSKPIGEAAKYDAKSSGDRKTNALSILTGESVKHKGYDLQVDNAAFQTNALQVATEANDGLVKALAKER